MSSAVFPALAGLGWGVIKSPQWNSRVQQAVGGRETRLSYMQLPRWKWTLTYEFLRTYTPAGGSPFIELQTLAEFFNDRQGKFDSFLYADPSDSVISDASPSTRQVFGAGTGSQVAFQLGRSLTTSGILEPLYNLNSTPKIYINNVLKTVATDYTISGAGLVTFGAAPAGAAVLTWSGSYYWRARFDQDSLDFEGFANGLWKQGGLVFLSVLGS